MVFFQVFVNPQSERLPLKYFLSTSNLVKAVKNLKYQSLALGQPQSEAEFLNKTIKVTCLPTCQFNLSDQTLPALVEGDPQARLKDLKLHFYDQTRGLIGYQTLSESPVFYVIDTNQTLLQAIQLNLSPTVNLVFKAYYPDTKQILFHSDNQGFFYTADQPALMLQSPE